MFRHVGANLDLGDWLAGNPTDWRITTTSHSCVFTHHLSFELRTLNTSTWVQMYLTAQLHFGTPPDWSRHQLASPQDAFHASTSMTQPAAQTARATGSYLENRKRTPSGERRAFSAFLMSYADVEALLRRFNGRGITKRDVIVARGKDEVPSSLITFLIIPHLSHRTQPAYTASCLTLGEYLKECDVGGFIHNSLAEGGLSQIVGHELDEFGGRKRGVPKVWKNLLPKYHHTNW